MIIDPEVCPVDIASRTPEGDPTRCPLCGAAVRAEPSDPSRDAPCAACGHLIWFEAEASDDEAVIRPAGPFVHAEQVRRILDLFESRSFRRVVLDLEAVRHLESAALSALLEWKKRLHLRRCDFVLRRPHGELLEVFRITRLDQFFAIEE